MGYLFDQGFILVASEKGYALEYSVLVSKHFHLLALVQLLKN